MHLRGVRFVGGCTSEGICEGWISMMTWTSEVLLHMMAWTLRAAALGALLALSQPALAGAEERNSERTDTQTFLDRDLLRSIGSITPVDTVAASLKAGASTRCADEGGNTPLHLAAAKGNAAVARLLLQRGADAEAMNGNGWTSLHAAAYFGYVSVIDVLLRAGASVDRPAREDQRTAPSLAKAQGHAAASELFERFAIQGEAALTPPPEVVAEGEAAGEGESGESMPRLRRNYGARSVPASNKDEL